MDLQFICALSHRTIFAEIPKPDPIEPDANLLPYHDVLDAVQPLLERLHASLGQIIGYRVGVIVYRKYVAYKLQKGKSLLRGWKIPKSRAHLLAERHVFAG